MSALIIFTVTIFIILLTHIKLLINNLLQISFNSIKMVIACPITIKTKIFIKKYIRTQHFTLKH